MASLQRVSASEAAQIRDLSARIGEQRFRILLTEAHVENGRQVGARLIRPERLSNLWAGSGKLSSAERDTLSRIRNNAAAIQNLGKRGDKRGYTNYKTSRAIREWIQGGKEQDSKRRKDDAELRAIKGLRLLGVEVDEGHFYLKGITH